ncbi:MAG: ribonuclease D [Proteobacteria bacterium]|nr:ribonuclease D [Pseudomonadota bacterium]
MPVSPLYIDTPDQLGDLCAKLAGTPWIVMDTEFLREKTYFPKFCLLQIAAPDVVACVDPIALESLGPLFDILFDPGIIKIFHSGRQDLEIFYNLCGKLPGPVFDTQIAAPLLGLGEQISYAGLVAELLGVNLTKSHSRTDWTRRPLSPEQLSYAADDVIYLEQAYLAMLPRLEKLGRLTWLEADFKELLDPSNYENPQELAWQRIGGVNQLKNKPLSIVQTLAAWREQTARSQDLPRGWVIKDDALLDLARQQPTNLDDLKLVRGLDERMVKRHGMVICRLIQEAMGNPPRTLEHRPRSSKKTGEQDAVLDLLMAVVRLRATQNTLNPTLLASRKDLEQLLDDDPHARLLHGWRKTMVGDELAAVLRGEMALKIVNGGLSIESNGDTNSALSGTTPPTLGAVA